MKTCPKCKVEKQVCDFYKNRSQSSGYSYYCKDCAKEVQRRIYAENPEKYRTKTIEYKKKHGPLVNARRKANRREIYIAECVRKYGGTAETIRGLLSVSVCPICLEKISFSFSNIHRRPNIDHCHKTGKIRGVLCGYCNNILGRAHDNIEVLQRAIDYLTKNG